LRTKHVCQAIFPKGLSRLCFASNLNLISITILAVLCLCAPQHAHAQQQAELSTGPAPERAPEKPTPQKRGNWFKRPVESELIIEGEGSFGNYQIFAAGTASKLFSAGVEYDRHSWGHAIGARVDYVAEFLPFVLLEQPAILNYYGVPRSHKKVFVPGIGIAPIGFRMLWFNGRAIKPYIMAKGGILAFTQKAESPDATYENFSLESDAGVMIRLNNRIDLRMGAGDFHFSNAFITDSNPGLDVMSYTGGISYHLWQR
jgi:hypothetical protein